MLFSTASLRAASFTWTNLVSGNASGNWTNSTSWNPNGVPGTVTADTVDFSALDINANSTVTLNTNVNVGSMIFGDTTTASAAGWIVNAGSPAGVITNGAGTITVNALGGVANPTNFLGGFSNVTINPIITGTSGLTKAGAGALMLGGANTFTNASGGPGVTISGGRLHIANDNNLGAVPVAFSQNNVTINTGATLSMNNSVTLGVNRGVALGSGGGDGSFDVVSSGTATVPGVVKDNGGAATLIKSAVGTAFPAANGSLSGSTLTLRGVNTYSGGTVIKGGFVVITNDFNFGAFGTSITLDGGIIALQTASTTLTNRTIKLGPTSGNGAGALDVQNTLTINGQITDNGGTGRLVKQQTGTAIVTGENGDVTYTGGTLIVAGTLQFGNGLYSVGESLANITNNATLAFNEPSDFTYSSILRGSGSLTLLSTNVTMTLGAANVYSNTTTVAAGILQYGVVNAIPHGVGFGNVAVNSAISYLYLNDFSPTINGLSGAGNVLNNGGSLVTLTLGDNDQGGTFSGTIGGPMAITKIGTNTLTISGPNSYSGDTLVQTGKLVISTLNANNGNFSVSNNAALGVTVTSANFTSGQTAFNSLTLGSGGSTTLEFNNVTNTTSSGPAPISVSTLTPNGTVTLNLNSATIGTSQFPLIQYGGGAIGGTGYGSFVVGALPPGIASVLLSNNLANGTIDIVPILDVWTGAVNGNWDFATTNWTQFGGSVTFANGFQAFFDDTSARTNVNLTMNVAPSGITLNNIANNYTFSSATGKSIDGIGFLFKNGTGALTILNSNSFSGTTRIAAGTLVAGNSYAIGGSTLDLDASDTGLINFSNLTAVTMAGLQGARPLGLTNATGGALALTLGSSANAGPYSSILSGSGSLTKVGTNTQTLSANINQSFAGPTIVSNGVLALGGGGISLPILTNILNSFYIAAGATVSNSVNGGGPSRKMSGAGTYVMATGVGGGLGGGNSDKSAFTGKIVIYRSRWNMANQTGIPSNDLIGNGSVETALEANGTSGQVWLTSNPSEVFNHPLTLAGRGWPNDNPPNGAMRFSGAGSASVAWAGPITLSADAQINTTGSGNPGGLFGTISGPYRLALGGNGTTSIQLTSPNTTASTVISSTNNGNPTINALNSNALSTGPLTVSTVAAGQSATLNLMGNNFTFASLLGTGAGDGLGNAIIQNNSGASPAILTVGTDDSSTTYSGALADPLGNAPLSFVKTGAGTLTLSGPNSYGGTTRIAAGSILLGAANSASMNSTLDMNAADSGTIDFGSLGAATFGGLQGSRNLVLQNNGGTGSGVALTVDSGNIPNGSRVLTIYSGVLSGTGASLTKAGASTLILSGANTYDSGTIVNGGTLVVSNTTGSATGSGAVTLNSGKLTGPGMISGAVAANTGATVETASTLTLSGGLSLNGAALSYDLSAPANAGVVSLGSSTLTIGGSTVVRPKTASVGTGVYALINNIGSVSGSPSFSAELPRGLTQSFGTAAPTFTLTIGGSAAPGSLVWSNAAGNWDVITTGNWKNLDSGAFDIFFHGDKVLFTNIANYTVTVPANVVPNSVTFSNTAGTTTMQGGGAIIGGTSLLKVGGGTVLFLGMTNNYTGGTVIGGGTLQVGDGTLGNQIPASIGTGTITITNAGILRVGVTASTTTRADYPNNLVINNGVVRTSDGYTHLATAPGATISVGASGATFQGDNANKPLWLDGIVTSSGSITLSGAAANIHFNNSGNTYNGTVSLSANAILTIDNNSALSLANVAGSSSTSPGIRFAPGVAAPVIGSLAGSATMNLGIDNGIGTAFPVPVSLTVGGNNSNTLYSGVIAGALASSYAPNGALTKAGTGTMILAADNTYRGVTTISGGTLQLGNAGGSGSVGGFSIVNNAALVFSYNRGDTITNSADISGSGSLSYTNVGVGVLTLKPLSGANSYQGNTVIAAGTVKLGVVGAIPSGTGKGNLTVNGILDINGLSPTLNGLSGSGNVDNLTAGGSPTLTVGANDQSSSFGGTIKNTSGTLALIKTGSGTVNLNGGNTYTGSTTVSGGKLGISTLHQGGGTITVNSGNALDVSVAGAGTLPVSTLTLSGSSILEFAGLSSTTVAPVTATNLAPGTVTINILSGGLLTGNQYPLIRFTSYNNGGTFTLGSLPVGVTANLVTNGGNTIALNVTAAVPAIWTGVTDNNWDINTTTNWTISASPAKYLDGQAVQFDDTSSRTNVNLTTTVSPGAMTVNSTRNYAFSTSASGKIGGSGSLTKSGSGSLTLTNLANTYSGVTTIGGGTVVVIADNNLGAASPGNIVFSAGTLSSLGTFTLNAGRSVTIGPSSGSGGVTFDVDTNQTVTFNGVIANNGGGTGSLTKTSHGSLTLGGANTYSGSTLVGAGTLGVSTLQQGGGAFTVSDGAALAASASGGITLPMSGLTLGTAGATTLMLNNVSGTNAPITATNLTANGTVTVSVLSAASGLYKLGNSPLIKYTGTINGAGFSAFALGTLPIGVSGFLTNNTVNQSVDVVVTIIPTVIWTGSGGQAWDIGGTVNWQIGGTNVTYQDGESVRFDDSAPGNLNVQFNTPVSPSGLTVSNTTVAYSFSPNGGRLAGNGTFTKSGNNTLLISPPSAVGFDNSTYTGTVIINGGAINISANAGAFNPNEGINPLGIGPLIISNNASLNYNGGQVQTGTATLTTNYQAITLAGGNIFSFETERHFVGPINVVSGTTNALTSSGAGGSAFYAGKIFVLNGVLSGGGNLTIPIPGTTHRNPIRFMHPENPFSGTLQLAGNGSAYLDSGTTMANATVDFAATGGARLTWNNSISTLVLGGLSGVGDMDTAALNELQVGGNGSNTLYAGALTGGAAVTKVGTGTLTLSGANSYSGLTMVSNGALVISTLQQGGGDVVVNDGKTLGVINNEGGQSALMNNLTLGVTAGPTTLVITNVTDPLTPIITAGGVVTLNGNCTITIPTPNSMVAGNVYPLVKYGSLGGAGSFLLSLPAGVTATLTNDTFNQWIALDVTGIAPPVNVTPTNITMVATNGGLQLSWPLDHTGWRLQAQTNSLSVGIGTNWSEVAGSSSTNEVFIPIVTTNGTVFLRLVYP